MLKCGEDIIVGRGEHKTLKFWSAEDNLLQVQVVPADESKLPRPIPAKPQAYNRIPGLSEAIKAHKDGNKFGNKKTSSFALHYSGNPDIDVEKIFDDNTRDDEKEDFANKSVGVSNNDYYETSSITSHHPTPTRQPPRFTKTTPVTETVVKISSTNTEPSTSTKEIQAKTSTETTSTTQSIKLVTFFPDLQNYNHVSKPPDAVPELANKKPDDNKDEFAVTTISPSNGTTEIDSTPHYIEHRNDTPPVVQNLLVVSNKTTSLAAVEQIPTTEAYTTMYDVQAHSTTANMRTDAVTAVQEIRQTTVTNSQGQFKFNTIPTEDIIANAIDTTTELADDKDDGPNMKTNILTETSSNIDKTYETTPPIFEDEADNRKEHHDKVDLDKSSIEPESTTMLDQLLIESLQTIVKDMISSTVDSNQESSPETKLEIESHDSIDNVETLMNSLLDTKDTQHTTEIFHENDSPIQEVNTNEIIVKMAGHLNGSANIVNINNSLTQDVIMDSRITNNATKINIISIDYEATKQSIPHNDTNEIINSTDKIVQERIQFPNIIHDTNFASDNKVISLIESLDKIQDNFDSSEIQTTETLIRKHEDTTTKIDAFKGYDYYEPLYDSLMTISENLRSELDNNNDAFSVPDFDTGNSESMKQTNYDFAIKLPDTPSTHSEEEPLSSTISSETSSLKTHTSSDSPSQDEDSTQSVGVENNTDKTTTPFAEFNANEQDRTMYQDDKTGYSTEGTNFRFDTNEPYNTETSPEADYDATKESIPHQSNNKIAVNVDDIEQTRVSEDPFDNSKISHPSIVQQDALSSSEHKEEHHQDEMENNIFNSIATIIRDTLSNQFIAPTKEQIKPTESFMESTTLSLNTADNESQSASTITTSNHSLVSHFAEKPQEMIEIPVEIVDHVVKVSQTKNTTIITVPITVLESEETFANYVKEHFDIKNRTIVLQNDTGAGDNGMSLSTEFSAETDATTEENITSENENAFDSTSEENIVILNEPTSTKNETSYDDRLPLVSSDNVTEKAFSNSVIDILEQIIRHESEFDKAKNSSKRLEALESASAVKEKASSTNHNADFEQTRDAGDKKDEVEQRKRLRNPARKDDSGDIIADAPFFIKLPGSIQAVPLYIEIEPVQVKYVSSSSREGSLNLPPEKPKEGFVPLPDGVPPGSNESLFPLTDSIPSADSVSFYKRTGIEHGINEIEEDFFSKDPLESSRHDIDQSKITSQVESDYIIGPDSNKPPAYENDIIPSPAIKQTPNTHASIDIPFEFLPKTSSKENRPDPFEVIDGPNFMPNKDDYEDSSLGKVNDGTIYGAVDLETLSNPVFSLQTKMHRPTHEDLMNPAYTPFPITTNPPRAVPTTDYGKPPQRTQRTSTTQVPVVEPALPHSTTSKSLRESVENSDMSNDIFVVDKIENANINSNTVLKHKSNEEPYKDSGSVEYRGIPSGEFSISYSPSDVPKFIQENPDSFPSWYPQASNENSYRASALTATEPDMGARVAHVENNHASEEFKKFASSKVSTSVRSEGNKKASARKTGLTLGNEAAWGDSDSQHYGAFYHPADIPGVMMSDLAKRHLKAEDNPDPDQLPWYKKLGSGMNPEHYSSDSSRSDGNSDLLFGPQFFQYLNDLPSTLLHDFLEPSPSERAVRIKRENNAVGQQIYCEWNIKTEPRLFLLITFHNLSAPYSVGCHGAYIEVERENNGYDARYCGNRAAHMGSRPHVIFAKSEVRITVYDDGNFNRSQPTGFEADIEVIDLHNQSEYAEFMRSNQYPHIRRLLRGR